MADDCTPDSFKRARCWGETHEEARSAVIRHLVYSSHHNISEDDAEILVGEAVIEQEDWTSAKPARSRLVSPSPKHRKKDKKGDKKEHKSRHRSRSPTRPSARSSRSPPPSAMSSGSQLLPAAPKQQAAAAIVNSRIAELGAGQVFVEVLDHCASLMADFKRPPPPQPVPTTSASSTDLVTPRFQHKADILMVPAEKVKHAIDALGRGIMAATHAQRLALAAANSFSVEVEVLCDVKKTLETVMTSE